jgi:hypothetical protein
MAPAGGPLAARAFSPLDHGMSGRGGRRDWGLGIGDWGLEKFESPATRHPPPTTFSSRLGENAAGLYNRHTTEGESCVPSRS